MNFESKKISFGFNKPVKKLPVLAASSKADNPVELIDCLEGSQIKVKNAVLKVEKKPLVISIKGNANNLINRIERESQKNRKLITEEVDERSDSELTIEELAARQLLREARNRLSEQNDPTKVHTVPIIDENIEAMDGEEPSIEDYESVPISDYGLAMLRGMGWKDGMSVGRNQSKAAKPLEPKMRPKGLGLGAQDMVNTNSVDVFDKSGKKLILTKGSHAKIIAGLHKGVFCEVQGLDDEAGRIILKISKTNEVVTLNELFVTPISKQDFELGLRVINNAKYEQYRETEINSANNLKSEDQACGKSIKKETGNSEKNQKEKIKTGNKYHSTRRKSSSRTKDYSRDSTDDERKKSAINSRIKDYKQHSSKNKSNEGEEYTGKHRKKKTSYSSEGSSSNKEYYKRKSSNHNRKQSSSYEDSSPSDEDSYKIKTKKREILPEIKHKRKKSKNKKKVRKYGSESKSKKISSRSRHEASTGSSDT